MSWLAPPIVLFLFSLAVAKRHQLQLQAVQDTLTYDHQGQGDVCFFVNTHTSKKGGYRDQAAAVAETWGKSPASRSRVFYIVDESDAPYHLPASVKSEQIIKGVPEDYEHLTEHTRQLMIALNTQELKTQCKWFGVADDDAYVNTASVVAKLQQQDASKAHYMGALYDYGNQKMSFVHGDLILYSVAAIPLVAKAMAQCDDMSKYGSFDDVALAGCFASLDGKVKKLQPESFGFSVHDNDHKDPKTMQKVLQLSQQHVSLACLDVVHKLLPQDMHDFHAKLLTSAACAKRT